MLNEIHPNPPLKKEGVEREYWENINVISTSFNLAEIIIVL
jgi:hypothetical protein